MPGLPQVEAPECVRNVDDFVTFLDSVPDTAFLPGPVRSLSHPPTRPPTYEL